MYWFLISELPRKMGYLRFVAIAFCDIVFFATLIFLLSAGYISLLLLMILALIVDLLGVYYLKDEFVRSVKKDFRDIMKLFK